MKNGYEVTLNVSSNVIGNSNDETNFPHKLLLTDTQVTKTRNAFANGSSVNVKFSKTQLSKIIQSGGFNFLDLLNLAKLVYEISNKTKNLFNKMSLNEVIKSVDVARKTLPDYKKIIGTGITLRNNEIKYIIKVIKSLK